MERFSDLRRIHVVCRQCARPVILRSPRILQPSMRLAPPCAGLEGCRPQDWLPPRSGNGSGRRPSRLTRPKEAVRAPQGDGDIDVLAAAANAQTGNRRMKKTVKKEERVHRSKRDVR